MTEFKVAMQAYLRKLPEAEREKLALDGKKLPNAKVNAVSRPPSYSSSGCPGLTSPHL